MQPPQGTTRPLDRTDIEAEDEGSRSVRSRHASALLATMFAGAVLKKSERVFAGVRSKAKPEKSWQSTGVAGGGVVKAGLQMALRDAKRLVSECEKTLALLKGGVHVDVRRLMVMSISILHPGDELLTHYGWDAAGGASVDVKEEGYNITSLLQRAADDAPAPDQLPAIFDIITPEEREAPGTEAILGTSAAGHGLKLTESEGEVAINTLLLEYSGGVWTEQALYSTGVDIGVDTLKREAPSVAGAKCQGPECHKDACVLFRGNTLCEEHARGAVVHFFGEYAMQIHTPGVEDVRFVSEEIAAGDVGRILLGVKSNTPEANWVIMPVVHHQPDILDQRIAAPRAPLINEARPADGDRLKNGAPALVNVAYIRGVYEFEGTLLQPPWRRVTLHHTLEKGLEGTLQEARQRLAQLEERI